MRRPSIGIVSAVLTAVVGLFLAMATLPPPSFAQVDPETPGIGAQTGDNAIPAKRTSTEDPRAMVLDESLAGPVDARSYRLGPGDVLSLEMSGRTARQVPIVVDAEGRANFPELGVIGVGGRTLAEVRDQVLGRLRSLYSGVRVDLRLVRLRSFKVYVAGQVEEPGVTRATSATRASEILRGSFALKKDASRRNIELRRRGGKMERVDLDAFAYLGRESENPYLEDGDVVLVPPRKESISALGAFGRPGEYERAPGDSISDLIEIAGGILPGTDPGSGLLVRFTSPTQTDSMKVDLAAAAARTEDGPLQDQDRLFARSIPEYKHARNVTITGEIMLPGPYPIVEGKDRLAALLGRAGGFTQSADTSRILVYRPPVALDRRDIELERLSRLSRSEMSDAEYQVFRTKLAAQQAAYVVPYDQLKLADAEYDVLLRDGDVVVVDRATQAVRVAGQVRRPSLIEYAPGRSVDDYIKLAGGYTGRAQKSKVRITRAGSDQTLLRSDVREIRPDDFIWVPEKKDINYWAVLRDVILVAGSVATVIILLRD